jgi:hypothetical protein
MPIKDSLFAAALVHGLTIVTRNRADFEKAGVGIIDPFAVRSGRTRPLIEHPVATADCEAGRAVTSPGRGRSAGRCDRTP